MSNKIEQYIEEIEDYINSCKYKTLSNTQIIVDKEYIDDLLKQLKSKIPDEVRYCQQIYLNRDNILADAKEKAAALINKATIQTNELINEHEIMQQAYTQANDVVTLASTQAQGILDSATIEANTMREAAIKYTDDMLAVVETIISQCMEGTTFKYEELMNGLSSCYETIKSNRAELNPIEDDSAEDSLEDSIPLDVI